MFYCVNRDDDRLAPQEENLTIIKQCKKQEVVSIRNDESIGRASHLMVEHHVGTLPKTNQVLEDFPGADWVLIGVFSLVYFLAHLLFIR